MHVKRLEHATQIIEHDGARLVIDPGMFSSFETSPTGVAGIVITHEHQDHWQPDNVRAILAANPSATVVGTQAVAASVDDIEVTPVVPQGSIDLEPFQLTFFGGRHAIIHESIPVIDNVGVLVNGAYFYGGDSLEPPGVPVTTLAVPTSAPWMKLGEMMDYVLEVAPTTTFAVHDMVNSSFGNSMANARLEWATNQAGGSHHHVDVGDSLAV